MNNMQKVLIQASFQRVLPIADVAAELFYGRLFELDPTLRPMFRGDMASQGKKLMNALRLIVNGLDRLDQLVPALEALARRHVKYGVTDEHYETVGAALIWTLQQGLGDSFTPSVAAAWVKAYGLIAGVMRAASAQPVVAAPPSLRAPVSRTSPLSQRIPSTRRVPHAPMSQPAPF